VATRVIVERSDGKWGWQLVSRGHVIATDGNQGYENESDCREMADKIISGHYVDADKKIRRRQ